jgi:F-type H+-transporting ATPase subunit gamma
MQMVAAAKLRRAQEAAEAARPYAERMTAVLGNVSSAMVGRDDAPRLLAGNQSDKTHLLVVCTAERGLCGGFNAQIVRLAREHINRLLAEGKEVKIITVGKKGADALRRDHGSRIIDRIELRNAKSIEFGHAAGVQAKVLELFDQLEFDVCTLFYSKFKSVIAQIPTALQIVPVLPPADASKTDSVYEYEPDEAAILQDLLPRSISVQIFTALLENAASEQGARMSAMDNATRNAGEMINKLSLQYNRSRQASITKELIEIISGAEAL